MYYNTLLRICKELFFRTQKLNYLNGKLSENKEITVNDVLFSRNGNVVTMSSQGNWTLHGTLSIPDRYRPKNKTMIIVHDTSTNNMSVEFLDKGASKYVSDRYLYIYGTLVAE